jgi:hypothetical protein
MQQQDAAGPSARPPAALLGQLRCNVRRALEKHSIVMVARVGDPAGLLPLELVAFKKKVGGSCLIV